MLFPTRVTLWQMTSEMKKSLSARHHVVLNESMDLLFSMGTFRKNICPELHFGGAKKIVAHSEIRLPT